MKRTNLILVVLLFLSITLVGQETEEFQPSGKAFGKVFFNYHYDATKDAEQVNQFELQRAYLGYKYKFSPDISLKITLDGARSLPKSNLTTILKHAQIDWKVAEPVKLSIGVIGLKQFNVEEKFWGYRYIYKTFQDEFAFGSSADLGVNAEIKLTETLMTNLFILNGEGNTRPQDDLGRLKAGGNLVFQPIEGLTFKGYYDIYGGNVAKFPGTDSIEVVKDTASIHSFAFFAGYKTSKFRIGAEYDLQLNGTKFNQIAEGYNLTGFAVYGTYVINEQFEVFAQWLHLQSNKVNDEDIAWHYNEDGNVYTGGIQYKPVKGIKVALNYRTFISANNTLNNVNKLYLNFEYAF